MKKFFIKFVSIAQLSNLYMKYIYLSFKNYIGLIWFYCGPMPVTEPNGV